MFTVTVTIFPGPTTIEGVAEAETLSSGRLAGPVTLADGAERTPSSPRAVTSTPAMVPPVPRGSTAETVWFEAPAQLSGTRTPGVEADPETLIANPVSD